jgi:hypothetical protein
MEDLWIPFAISAGALALILAAGAAAAFLLIKRNKPNAERAVLSARVGILQTPLARDAVFARLKAASLGRFKLADVDERKKVLVFRSAVTSWSWGFFFPIFLTPTASGTRLDVGIKSRLLQYGPVVTNTHREFMAELERTLEPDSTMPNRLAA